MMMRVLRLGLSLIAAALVSGCAGLSVTSVNTEAEQKAARGYRYYQEAPWLFVRSDGNGGISGEVLWMEDTTQMMSARPYAFMASNETKLVFTNSVLTNSVVKADETAVVKASLQALSKVLVAQSGAADAGSDKREFPTPSLYKIVVTDTGVLLLGGKGNGPDRRDFRLDVPMPRKEKP